MTPVATHTRIYRLLVRLHETRPVVWRRLEVAGGIELPWLHGALQVAMGWQEPHLGRFIVKGQAIDLPSHTGNRKLRNLGLAEGETLVWIHDIDRVWRHTLKVEAITTPQPGIAYPCLLGGDGSCPLEEADDPHDREALLRVSSEEEDADQDVHWAERDDLVHPRDFDAHQTHRRLQRALKARAYA